MKSLKHGSDDDVLKNKRGGTAVSNHDDHTARTDDYSYTQDAPRSSSSSKSGRGRWSSFLHFMLVLLVAAGTGLLAYYLFAMTEQGELAARFKVDAVHVSNELGRNLQAATEAADDFAKQFVSHAENHKSSWPFVTLPKFCTKANHTLQSSNAFSLSFDPLMPLKKQTAWLEYAEEQYPTWVEDCHEGKRERGASGKGHHHLLTHNFTVCGDAGETTSTRRRTRRRRLKEEECQYQPTWQIAPLVPAAGHVHNRLLRDPAALVHATRHKLAVLAAFSNVLAGSETMQQAHDWLEQYRLKDSAASEPVGSMVYPIILESNNVGGALVLAFQWSKLIQNEEARPGMRVVFKEANCGPSFTYELHANNKVHYLGTGEIYDHTFKSLSYSVAISELLLTNRDTGLPLATGYCDKTVTIYPSATIVSHYTGGEDSSMRAAMCGALVTLITFILGSILLLMCCKTRSKKKRGGGGSFLQPYLSHDAKGSTTARAATSETFSISSMPSQSSAREDTSQGSSAGESTGYAATTVMVANVVGLEDWTVAVGTPASNVFGLFLDALHGAFDDLAQQHRVSVLETVDRRYVAAGGTSRQAPKDHALQMVKFSSSCLGAMERLRPFLSDRFGSEAASMVGLRLGLAQGAYTAGLLEKHGCAGRIHASQTTAGEIAVSGRRDWLERRESDYNSGDALLFDTMKRDGLGSNTYWVNPPVDVPADSASGESSKQKPAAGKMAPLEASVGIVASPPSRLHQKANKRQSETELRQASSHATRSTAASRPSRHETPRASFHVSPLKQQQQQQQEHSRQTSRVSLLSQPSSVQESSSDEEGTDDEEADYGGIGMEQLGVGRYFGSPQSHLRDDVSQSDQDESTHVDMESQDAGTTLMMAKFLKHRPASKDDSTDK